MKKVSDAAKLLEQVEHFKETLNELGVPDTHTFGDRKGQLKSIDERLDWLKHIIRDSHQALDFVGVPSNTNIAARCEWLTEHQGEIVEQEKIETLVADYAIQHGAVAVPMIEGLIKLVKGLKIPFSKLAEFQQQDFIDSVSARIRAQLAAAMRVMIAGEHPTFSGTLDNFNVKEGEITVKVKAPKSDDFLLALAHGGLIHFVFMDQRVIDDATRKEPKAEKDQPDLPIEEAIVDAPQWPIDEAQTEAAPAEAQQEEPAIG
jgi:hypothetical protein